MTGYYSLDDDGDDDEDRVKKSYKEDDEDEDEIEKFYTDNPPSPYAPSITHEVEEAAPREQTDESDGGHETTTFDQNIDAPADERVQEMARDQSEPPSVGQHEAEPLEDDAGESVGHRGKLPLSQIADVPGTTSSSILDENAPNVEYRESRPFEGLSEKQRGKLPEGVPIYQQQKKTSVPPRMRKGKFESFKIPSDVPVVEREKQTRKTSRIMGNPFCWPYRRTADIFHFKLH